MRYSDPKLCTYKLDITKPWFVDFTCIDDNGNKIYKQFRGGINYFHSKEERLRAGNALILYWKRRLREGWSPWEENHTPDTQNMQLNEAIDFALSQCFVAKKTKQGYRSTCGFFKEAASCLGYSRLPISSLKRTHIKILLQYIKEKRGWSNTAYNRNLASFKSVLSRLIDWEILEFNPAEKIKTLPVAETNKYVTYTQQEKKMIREYLYLHHYRFFVYFQVIYHTGIRPKEILALKIKDIDFSKQLISIFPDIEQGNSKTKSIRLVPVNNQLLPYLRELKLQEYSIDCFIFGSPYETGKGNKGSAAGKLTGAMHPDYFKPSHVQIKRDTVTKFWKKIVKDKLGIDKYLYAGKHTGADDKILAGIPIDALKELYGHSSQHMTEKYARKVKEVNRRIIIDKSPEF